MLRTFHIYLSILSLVILFLAHCFEAKTKITLIAGKDSHGTNAHNWGEGVDFIKRPYEGIGTQY